MEQGKDDHLVLLDHLVDDGSQHCADVGQHGETQWDPDDGVDHAEAAAPSGLRGYMAIAETMLNCQN